MGSAASGVRAARDASCRGDNAKLGSKQLAKDHNCINLAGPRFSPAAFIDVCKSSIRDMFGAAWQDSDAEAHLKEHLHDPI